MKTNSTLSRRRLLARVPAMAATLSPKTTALNGQPASATATSDADPIFAAIEQHREARAAYLAAMDVPGEDREIRCAEDACQQAEHDALYELFATAPTTTAGMAALFEHLASPRWEGDSGYTVIQSVVEDWGNDPEAANKWVTMMAETFRQMATTA